MMLKKLNAMMLFSIFLLSGVLLGGCSTNANSLVGNLERSRQNSNDDIL